MAVENNLEKVQNVLKNHKDEIIRTYKAHGVGIGKENPTDENYLIVVYVDNKHDVPHENHKIEDIPLKFIVTGPFNLQTL